MRHDSREKDAILYISNVSRAYWTSPKSGLRFLVLKNDRVLCAWTWIELAAKAMRQAGDIAVGK